MTENPRNHDEYGSGGVAGRLVFWGFLLVAGYFLVTEHRAHLINLLPFLLLLACPLMHLFHHHGTHGGREREGGGQKEAKP